jgi:hypothetical protein
VNVVRHQHIGVNVTAISRRAFQETVQIAPVVFICEKAGCAVVPTLDHVL